MDDKVKAAILQGLLGVGPTRGIMDLMSTPMTAAGLAKALMGGAEFEPGPAGTTVARMREAVPGGDAQALGRVISVNPDLDPRVAEQLIKGHELGHVAQSEALGPFASLVTLGMQGANALRGKDPYMTPMETSAPEFAQVKQLMDPEEGKGLAAIANVLSQIFGGGS